MKALRWIPCSLLLALTAAVAHAAPLGTAFTYQGQLHQSGSPVTGTAHFRFSLWDAASGGAQVGVNQVVGNVPVSAGIFTVQLNGSEQFTDGAFNGDARWLQVEVCTDASCASSTLLSPRQPLTGTPYAHESIQSKSLLSYGGGVIGELHPGSTTNSPGIFTDRFHHSTLIGSYLEGGSAHGFLSTSYASGAARKISIGRASGSDFSTATFEPILTVQARDARVGINNSSPEFPLSFDSGTGDKIALTAGAQHFGFGVQSNLLQIHTANNVSSIGFGYGSSGSFTERMRIDGSGRVGIGTSLPTEVLDVRGSIRMGSTGSDYAAGGNEELRLVRGSVNGSGTGTIEYGSGFTLSNDGNYRKITFDTPFSSPPTVVATSTDCTGCFVRMCEIKTVTTTYALIAEYNRHDGSFSGGPFHFIAMGPR